MKNNKNNKFCPLMGCDCVKENCALWLKETLIDCREDDSETEFINGTCGLVVTVKQTETIITKLEQLEQNSRLSFE
ncbi:hypothetical protein P261_00500 [Lachnospiraceae bacterium TWA4]|nr:hypothetical protein P261_00500 [Lachnospiraceae bacterium TWA4]